MATKTIIAATLLAFLGISGKTASFREDLQTPLEDRLYEIGIESTKDNIERGGIVSGKNVYEIENDARHSPERLRSFMKGDNTHYSTLKTNLLTAYSVRCVCSPELAPAYTAYSLDLNNKIDLMLILSDEQRKKLEGHTKWLFEQFLPHGIYMANKEQQKLVQARLEENSEQAGFHTHPSGDPPSLQDIKISHWRKEYVVSVNTEGEYTLYLVDKGNVKIVHTAKR